MTASSDAAASRSGPTQPPADAATWPGRGNAWIPPGFAERRDDFWQRRAAERGAVAFLGDSITQCWTTLAEDFPGLRVANRGIGGDTTRGARWRFAEDVLAIEPSALVVLLGTNDLSLRADPADAADNLAAIIAAYDRQRPGRPLTLCRAMPRAYGPCPVDPARLHELNAAIDALARARPLTALCDTWGAFVVGEDAPRPELFDADLLHLAPAGYRRWRELLEQAFARFGRDEAASRG